MNILINGQLNDNIAVTDRGLQYGDGVFETIAVKHGECEHWYEHMSRLADGCRRLNISVPDAQQLLTEAQQLINDQEHAVLKIIITRGRGSRGYRSPDAVMPSRIISVHPWPVYPSINTRLGIQLTVCKTRLAHQPALAGIKHLNRLEQVLARNEWDDPDISEGLMSDIQGNVVEGTMSNVFIVINNELLTPKINDCGIAGIMRAHIISQASTAGMTVAEKNITLDDVLSADEMFVCNSIIGIWPIRQCLDKHYNVMSDITTKIMDRLR